LLVAIPAAFLVAGLVGIAIERGVIRFLYGRPLETLLATFGISLILQQLVRTTMFSPLNRPVASPELDERLLADQPGAGADLQPALHRAVRLLVFVALLLLLKKPRWACRCARSRRTGRWRARWASAPTGSTR
jgi:urea transport system permease protein